MKTLIIATVSALTLATAASADNAEYAAQHFAQSHEQGDGPRTAPKLTSEGEIMSTKGNDLAAFAAAKLANGPEDDR